MTGPWAWIKVVWYRHQAKRAILFLRYLDRVLHETGMGGAAVKRAWRDFHHSAYQRAVILNQVARANKIKLRRAARSKLEEKVFAMVRQVNALGDENAKLKAELVGWRDCQGSEKPAAASISHREDAVEISTH